MKIINFAHGEFLMLGAYITYFFYVLFSIDPLLSIFISMASLFLLGYFIEKYLIKWILKAPHFAQIALTLGLSISLQNIALILWTGNYRSVAVWYSASPLGIGPISISFSQTISFMIAIVLTVILYIVLTKTTFGKSLRAVSQNPELAEAMGINVPKIFTLAFCLGAMLAGAAGTLITITLYVFPQVGFMLAIKSFCIVIIGGLGSFVGAIAGSMLLGMLESIVSVYLPGGAGWAPAVFFLALLITLIIRPYGLLGVKE
jgi:branched-chain amino acid transport system permease protein